MRWDDIYDRSKMIVRQVVGRMLDEEAPKEPENMGGLENIVKHLQDSDYLAGELKRREHYDYRKAFQDMKRGERRRGRFRALTVISGAACILVAGCLLVFQWGGNEPQDVEISSNNLIQARGMKAILVKGNGEELTLDERSFRVSEDNGAVLAADSSGLQYEVADSLTEDTMVLNTLSVPRGGVYQLTLSDGTRVWLNSDSRLVYPVAFSGDAREVTLSGEAYFDVRKNAEKPFIVTTALGKVRVLGTQFNVKVYPEEASVITTLVSGSVSFGNEAVKETKLSPGYQLVFDKGNQEVNVKKVNVQHFVSWRDNQMSFQGESLESIMRMLARWYDVDVVFEDEELKQLEFSGNLDKYEDIGKFFKLFELGADVHFEIKDNVIYVRKKK